MKQVININFQGQVVPIEVTAFDILKQYTESLNRYFANEEGKEEIINDIENRIGELFQERLKTGATCITDDDVNAIIKSMGRPEEFEPGEPTANNGNQEYSAASSTGPAPFNTYNATGSKRLYRNENSKVLGGVCSGIANYLGMDVVIVRVIFIVLFGALFIPYLVLWVAVPSSASVVIGSPRKRLFRDVEDKIIGGVCSGIANYFGINVWIPRVLFLIPILSIVSRWGNWGDFPDFFRIGFSPSALIIYIILWLVIPEATTTSEKLEMKGEKVDMNTIKNSVMEEMKGMQQRAEKFGQEAKTFAAEKGKVVGAEMAPLARRSGRGLGDVIILLFKIFAYFIIGCIAIGLITALFGFGIVSIGMFPVKDFVLTDGWQNAFAWGTLIFFIAVPIIGVITWIIRRLAKIKTNRRLMRSSFIAMWVLGIICFIGLITTVGRDFRSISSINEEAVPLTNAALNKMEVTTLTPGKQYYRNQWFRMEPFSAIADDTAYVGNVRINIVKSSNDSFRVSMLRMANGRNRRSADTMASTINFNAYQLDSLLVIDRGLAINKTSKFRNQRVILTIYVPVGKQIRINENVGWGNNIEVNGPWGNDWNLEMDDIEQGWEKNVDYIMQEGGLQTLDGKPADEWKNEERVRINNDGIDIRDGKTRVRINENGIEVDENNDENYRYENERHQKTIDSIKINVESSQQKLKDSLQKIKEKIDNELKKIDNKIPGTTARAENIQFVLPVYNPLLMMK
ncbi:MAG: PspC domain-containing protein [Gloeobacteraceae cyanobacterium ES-bin-316]|nr:PspC domain-containing protein [Ferruginibacter sp.]